MPKPFFQGNRANDSIFQNMVIKRAGPKPRIVAHEEMDFFPQIYPGSPETGKLLLPPISKTPVYMPNISQSPPLNPYFSPRIVNREIPGHKSINTFNNHSHLGYGINTDPEFGSSPPQFNGYEQVHRQDKLVRKYREEKPKSDLRRQLAHLEKDQMNTSLYRKMYEQTHHSGRTRDHTLDHEEHGTHNKSSFKPLDNQRSHGRGRSDQKIMTIETLEISEADLDQLPTSQEEIKLTKKVIRPDIPKKINIVGNKEANENKQESSNRVRKPTQYVSREIRGRKFTFKTKDEEQSPLIDVDRIAMKAVEQARQKLKQDVNLDAETRKRFQTVILKSDHKVKTDVYDDPKYYMGILLNFKITSADKIENRVLDYHDLAARASWSEKGRNRKEKERGC